MMTKTIDTLVEDIYSVVDDGVDLNDCDDLVDQFASDLASQLKRRLGEPREEKERGLRLSSIGQCIRKQYFIQAGVKGERILPHTKIKFMYGDILEGLMLLFAKLAGHEVSGEQDEVELSGIKGHRDAVIDGYTVDIKSASKYGFQKFENGTVTADDSFGYTAQLAAYTEAAEDVKKDAAYNLAVSKELGKIALYKLDSKDMPDIRTRVNAVVAACTSDLLPDREYEAEVDGKSGNKKLPVACSYCEFKKECWSDANEGKGIRTFLYSQGPRYLVEVVREPEVQEVL